MELLISNQQDAVVVEEAFITFCKQTINRVWQHLQADSQVQLSVVFVDDDTMRKLNLTYRQQDNTTDVLSFPLYDEADEIQPPLVGEIVISLERALEQSKTYEQAMEKEVAFLLVHGLLHLCGYDHDDNNSGEMRQKEQELMRLLGMKS